MEYIDIEVNLLDFSFYLHKIDDHNLNPEIHLVKPKFWNK